MPSVESNPLKVEPERIIMTHSGAAPPSWPFNWASVPAPSRYWKTTPLPGVTAISAKLASGASPSRTMIPALVHWSL